jgi:hypothetical protein
MTGIEKKEPCLVIENEEVVATEIRAEKAEEKVEGAVVAVVDVHAEAAEVQRFI